MVDFGGWDMPVVNYGSQIEEHHAVRNDCGMFDVSYVPVDVVGADRRRFLSRLVANDGLKLRVPARRFMPPCSTMLAAWSLMI